MEESAAPAVSGAQPAIADTPNTPDDIVERWWADHFPGSPLAQMTQAWNHAFAAKEELKRRIAHLFGSI